jgi:hypothetical protein
MGVQTLVNERMTVRAFDLHAGKGWGVKTHDPGMNSITIPRRSDRRYGNRGPKTKSLRGQKEETLAPLRRGFPLAHRHPDLVFVGDAPLEERNDVVGKILGCHRMGVDVPLCTYLVKNAL